MQYLVWNTITNRHTNLTLSFLLVGHTKFPPDWCFWLFKRSYRRMKVGSLLAIAHVVNSSADCNFSQLAVHEDGSIIMYNWTDFFPPWMKKISGIKMFHHFCVSSSSIEWLTSGHIQAVEVAMDTGCRYVVSSCTTTWAKYGTAVLVWLHSPVLPGQWQGHRLPSPFCS